MNAGVLDRSRALADKHILVTGGTGSLGRTLVRRLLTGEFGRPASVTVFSRDEAKQHDMRVNFHQLSVASEDLVYKDFQDVLKFRIGDVRNVSAVTQALRGVDVVFNAAALKQVPTCEYFPAEAVATNIIGVENIIRSIEEHDLPVEAVIGISTDKACKPVNAMGMTKALQERMMISANLRCRNTRWVCVRYGNVLASRGSVIPLFHSQIKAGGPLTLTTMEMTRFLLSLDQAVDTIVDAYRIGERGDTVVPRVPSSKIRVLAESLIGERPIDIVEIGIRPGEKVHEILVAEDEASRTTEREGYYVIRPALPELRRHTGFTPALNREYSSRAPTMAMDQTLQVLAQHRLRVEDHPDFDHLFG